MKKSEMVEKIAIPVSVLAGGFLTGQEIRESAEHLINILEKNGMLPPYNPIGSERDDGAVQCCQWSPEE